MKFFKELKFKIRKLFDKKADALETEMIVDHVKDEIAKMNEALNRDVKTVAKFSLKIDEIKELIQTKKNQLDEKTRGYAKLLQDIKANESNPVKADALKNTALSELKTIKFLEKHIGDLEELKANDIKEYEKMIITLRALKQKITDKQLEADKAITNYELQKLKKSVNGNLKLDSYGMVDKTYLKKLNDEIKTSDTVDDINEKIGNDEKPAEPLTTATDADLLKELNEDIQNA